MHKKFFICFGIILLIFYLTTPIPYCTLWDDEGESIKIETTGNMSEIITSKLILLHVMGESMLPTIKDNSKCLCVRIENYSVGDIIAFQNEVGESISHRILSIGEEKIFTKGDNNEFIDSPITKENIMCRIPYVPRYVVLINGLD